MRETAPLWALCSVNDEALSDKTNPSFSFEYVDISNVSEGHIRDDLETLTFAAAPSRARRIARPGDVIVSTVRTYLRAIARVEETENQRIYSTGFAVLRPDLKDVDPRYIGYVLGSDQVMDEIVATSVGVSYPAIQATALQRIRIPFAPLDDQQRIADYLDRETGGIDAMIAKLDALTTQIRERRGALWSSVFAQGFEMQRLQWFVEEIDERADGALVDLPMLSVSIHHGIQRREDSTSKQRAGEDLTKYKVARAGDIVVNRMRAFQGGLGRTSVDGLVSPDYAVLRPTNGFNSRWGEYVMRSPRFIAEMSQRLRGIGGADQTSVRTPRINVRDLVLIMIPVADPDSLEAATTRLDAVTGRMDQMLTKVSDLKSLLLERRAALITDVVTGKKEVA
ncbi:restriction endonuclease subunit S [Kocuria palustris]|uniref:restriction endonuclease subunit S n=1 Tax=Kocuria palustris TaxID=71999 RepID=UPI00077B842D|nr:restriction endonuclease subunit S [Kocuria palustris]